MPSTAAFAQLGVRTGGLVATFDESEGLGTLTDAVGGTWPFHCVAIADGTRTVPVGAEVEFALASGHGGRIEAVGITRR